MIRPLHHQLSAFAFLLAALTLAASAFAQSASPTPQSAVALAAISGSKPLHDGIAIQAGPATLQITALRSGILRVRITPLGEFPEDASWAVLPGPRTTSVEVQPIQDSASVGFRTASLEVRIERDPLRLVVRDLAGNIVCADAPGMPTEFSRGGFTVSKEMSQDEHFYGLGDKTGTFDRRYQAHTLWNTDAGISESGDLLYKSIPFFLATRSGR